MLNGLYTLFIGVILCILLCSGLIDGLKGFPEAINAVFPKTEVHLCIVHQIRNSLKYVGSTYQKQFASELKKVY